MSQLFVNNAASALATAIAAGDTVLSVASGAVFPTPSGGDFFLLTLIGLDANGNESAWEIVKVTARSGNALTAVRGQENTSALPWAGGTLVEARLTAGGLGAKENAIASGAAGQFWNGSKVWADFAASVRTSVLTGLSVTTSTAVAAADTFLVAVGKLQAQVSGKEPTIAAGTNAQFWLGDKSWQSLLSAVQGTLLTGYAVGANAALAATDTVLGALQKLQGQINNKLNLAGGTLTGLLTGTRALFTGTGNDYASGGVELRGDGAANTVFPTLGFHQASLYASSLQLRGGGDFRFYAQGGGSYANVTANNFNGAALSLTGRATVGDVYSSGWLRTVGAAGWYNETYAGGIYMTDATYVRTYNGKQFSCTDILQVEGATPHIRLSDTGWGTRYLYHDAGLIGFLNNLGGWSTQFTNDGTISTQGRIQFGEFTRGTLSHVIDGTGNRFVKLTNWDGAGVHVLHSPGNFLAFGPEGDNNHNCGWGYARWSNIWSVNGAIQTSDAREKTAVRPLNAKELAAAKQIAAEIGVYQWLEAVEKKGESARLHPGQTVQRIMAIMQSHDLDPFAYGFICYDEWEAVPSVYEEDGETVKVDGREAGNRYSMRYDELNVFMARGLARGCPGFCVNGISVKPATADLRTG